MVQTKIDLPVNQKELEEYLDFATTIAGQGAQVLEDFHGKIVDTDAISEDSPIHWKTKADDAVDQLVCKAIKARFPQHEIYSEEGGAQNVGSDFKWVVDALDGTLPFMHGTSDHFAVCVALAYKNVPIVGVVSAPIRKEVYSAAYGLGAHCNGEIIQVSDLTNINRVIMGIDSGKKNRRAHIPFVDRALKPDGIACPMCFGCASLPLCFVANGRMYAYMATSLEPEDMAAAVVIIREAGGLVTNLKGQDWKVGESSILAANPQLHAKLSQFFSEQIAEFSA